MQLDTAAAIFLRYVHENGGRVFCHEARRAVDRNRRGGGANSHSQKQMIRYLCENCEDILEEIGIDDSRVRFWHRSCRVPRVCPEDLSQPGLPPVVSFHALEIEIFSM